MDSGPCMYDTAVQGERSVMFDRIKRALHALRVSRTAPEVLLALALHGLHLLERDGPPGAHGGDHHVSPAVGTCLQETRGFLRLDNDDFF